MAEGPNNTTCPFQETFPGIATLRVLQQSVRVTGAVPETWTLDTTSQHENNHLKRLDPSLIRLGMALLTTLAGTHRDKAYDMNETPNETQGTSVLTHDLTKIGLLPGGYTCAVGRTSTSPFQNMTFMSVLDNCFKVTEADELFTT